MDDTLDFTALVPESAWELQYSTLTFFEAEERVHARYGYGNHSTAHLQKSANCLLLESTTIVILVVGFATAVVLTCLGYLPYMTGILERIKPYLVYPAAVRTYQVRPLPYLLGNAPTVGQSLYVAVMVILNVILTAVN
jgi:hypothetical protein